MTIKQWGFLLYPGISITLSRDNLLIGYPFSFTQAAPPVPTPPTPADTFVLYFKRYLDDPDNVPAVGPAVTVSPVPETADTLYLRRYLNDPSGN